jgi:16S rRNA (cytidine1402-2'-O)-methyltransferase
MTKKKSGADDPSPPAPVKQGSAKGSFSLVATPIGNAGDITLRALDALKAADVIYCEDTRVTSKLLAIHGISGKKLMAAHAHNERESADAMLRDVREGKAVLYASDAGMPCISDPGAVMVQHMLQHGINVTSLPGANAALTALQISGLPTDQFHFVGFLPPKTKARRAALEKLKSVMATLVFYESPHRVVESLKDMKAVLGERPCACIREITKMFEEARRGSISSIIDILEAKESIKGEFVIVVGAFSDVEEEMIDQAEIDRLLLDARKNLSARDAAAIMSTKTGIPKRELYQRLLHLNDKKK